jgi:hypothetical protein
VSNREQIVAKAEALDSNPIAIEALWDGDSNGWFIYLAAITADLQTHSLGVVTHGGDIRLFNGHVPPWPEAVFTTQLGNDLAQQFGAEFYFPSPNHPEDDCPQWLDREKGYPCRRCQILLLQPANCIWHGVCYHCHLDEEKASPRCHICGNLATNVLANGPVCGKCFDSYKVYHCEQCHSSWLGHIAYNHSAICSQCQLQKLFNALTTEQRDTIRTATSSLNGLQLVKKFLNCSLYDAQYVLHQISDPKKNDIE